MTATRSLPAALAVEPGCIPAELPTRLEDVRAPLRPVDPRTDSTAPTTLFLTVDVEDTYFDRPILMTGEGIGREYGVFGILDLLDVHDLKATFFVNVYEKDRQPAGVVENVVREIDCRGHEVGLHSHPIPGHEIYGRPLSRLSRSQQAHVLYSGVEQIERWSGTSPISFRAGGYALNDDTFDAMEEVGIVLDSSCFFPSTNNRHERFTVNAITANGSIVEAPITTVLQVEGDTVKHSKLDFNWLSVGELIAAIGSAAEHGAGFATFMMHSFSFVDKVTRRSNEQSSPAAIFTSTDVFGCFVDVFGARRELRISFSEFLDWIVTEPGLRVCTFAEAMPDLWAASANMSHDVVPVIVE